MKSTLFNNTYASRIYKRALWTIHENGFTIKSWDKYRASTEFVEKVIYLPPGDFNQARFDSLVVHEAHHVSTAHTRLSLPLLDMSDKEIFDWCINDEIQAYTKQYNFLGYFNPDYLKFKHLLIRAHLRWYYNYEVRGMLEQAHKIQKNYSGFPHLHKLQSSKARVLAGYRY